MEALLDGEAEALTRRAIEMALDGDGPAMRLCLERLCPPRKDRPISFTLPRVETAADAVKANSAILEAVAAGEITPGEGVEVAKLLESLVQSINVAEHEERLIRLEQRISQ
jgi:hypothetical protein